jgi:hypothetical protein
MPELPESTVLLSEQEEQMPELPKSTVPINQQEDQMPERHESREQQRGSPDQVAGSRMMVQNVPWDQLGVAVLCLFLTFLTMLN